MQINEIINYWLKEFDKEFPCSHHPSQCAGNCNTKYEQFIIRVIKDVSYLEYGRGYKLGYDENNKNIIK